MFHEGIFSNPEEIIKFTDSLRSSLQNYQFLMEQLESRLANLGRSWLDQQYKTFQEEVKKTTYTMSSFIEEGERVTSQLLQKADELEKYYKTQI